MGATYDNVTGRFQFNGRGLYKMTFPMLLEYAAKGKKFILIGDEHTYFDGLMTAISRESILAMKSAGVRHLGLEVPKEIQKSLNDFYSGSISFEQLKLAYANFNRPWQNQDENRLLATRFPLMIKEAKEAGIKIHFLDSKEKLPVEKQNPELAEIFDESMGLTPDQLRQGLAELEQTRKGITESFYNFKKTYIKQRLERDKATVNELKKLGGDGKVAVIYGYTHHVIEGGFNDLLGRENSVVIAIQRGLINERSVPDKNLPDFVYYPSVKSSGASASIGGRLQSDNARSPACQAAVNAAKKMFHLVACTADDTELQSYARNYSQQTRLSQPAR